MNAEPQHPCLSDREEESYGRMDLKQPKEGLMPGSSGGEELLYTGRPAIIQGFAGLLLAILTLGLSALVMWIRTRGTLESWNPAARANGWDAVGLNFPDHFLIRIEFNGRRIIIDPFNSGSVVTVPRLRELTKSKLGPTAELKPEYYMQMCIRDRV